jgi:adenylate cyclase
MQMKFSFKSYFFCLLGWQLANVLFVMIRFVGLSSVPVFQSFDYDSLDHKVLFLKSLVIAFFMGTLHYFAGLLMETSSIRRRPYGVMIALNLFVSVVCVFLVLVGLKSWELIGKNQEFTYAEFASRLFTINFVVLLTYNGVVSFAFIMIRQISMKFGPGNLRRLIMGTYYHPKSIEHIFMFLDLKDSTTHAERLGHLRFGGLIQDCFMDMSVVTEFGAEFYQYVGDESILYWNVNDGVKQANCLMAFYAFNRRLQERSQFYMSNYGIVPEFKAGVNIGHAVVLEVGEIKREIAYLGDVLNTAARIQGLCKVHSENLLMSENLFNRLYSIPENLDIAAVGPAELRGRSAPVLIYRVRERDAVEIPA